MTYYMLGLDVFVSWVWLVCIHSSLLVCMWEGQSSGVFSADPGRRWGLWWCKSSRQLRSLTSSRLLFELCFYWSIAPLLHCLVGQCDKDVQSDIFKTLLVIRCECWVHSNCVGKLCCSSLKAEQVYSQMDPAGQYSSVSQLWSETQKQPELWRGLQYYCVLSLF